MSALRPDVPPAGNPGPSPRTAAALARRTPPLPARPAGARPHRVDVRGRPCAAGRARPRRCYPLRHIRSAPWTSLLRHRWGQPPRRTSAAESLPDIEHPPDQLPPAAGWLRARHRAKPVERPTSFRQALAAYLDLEHAQQAPSDAGSGIRSRADPRIPGSGAAGLAWLTHAGTAWPIGTRSSNLAVRFRPAPGSPADGVELLPPRRPQLQIRCRDVLVQVSHRRGSRDEHRRRGIAAAATRGPPAAARLRGGPRPG